MRAFAKKPSLRAGIGTVGLFTIAFGVMVGSAWIVILGQWFDAAGPMGSVLGICAGAAAMAVISFSYAELMSRIPTTGGEIVYAFEVFGPNAAFAIGWLYIVQVIALISFEGIALSWILSVLAPNFVGPTLYTALGHPITVGHLAVGLCSITLITAQNYRGARNAIRLQTGLTVVFLVLALIAIGAGFVLGRPANLLPLFSGHGVQPWWSGAVMIFSSGILWFAGFTAIPQVIEERDAGISFRRLSWIMAVSILVAAVFYTAVILSVGMAQPWKALVNDDMMTASALGALIPGGILSKLVLVSGSFAILKAWNGGFLWATRTLFALSRAGFVTRKLHYIHPVHGTPSRSILLVGLINAVALCLGPGASMPILQVSAITVSIVMLVAILSLIVLRRRRGPQPAFSAPGGLFTIGLGLCAVLSLSAAALISPWFGAKGVPMEWRALGAWSTLGLVYWFVRRRHFDVAHMRATLLAAEAQA